MAGMGEIISRLAVSLSLETAAFEKGATIAEKRMAQTAKKFEALGKKIGGLGQTMSLAITAPFAAFAAKGVAEARETAIAMGQVEAALASMGPVAGKTAGELSKAADAFESKSLFEADVILRDVTANMLTFGNISGQAFDRAQQAAIDLATRLNIGPKEAAIQVGKALNDPIKGITAMGRAGIQFSEDQKTMIKSLVETGDTAKAQTIILGELEKQFGGAAAAAQNADPINKFTDAINKLAEAVGTKILPLLTPLIDKLVAAVDWFAALPAPVQEGTLVVAGIAAAMGPLLMVIGKITTALPLLMKALTFLFAHPIILGAAALIGGIYLAWKNWDKITAIVQRVYQGVKTWLQDKLGAVFDWVKGKLSGVRDAFQWLGDQLVFNSIVPDMVDGIGAQMARLDSVMVNPALVAVQKVNAAFAGLSGIPSGMVGATPGLGGPERVAALGGTPESSNDNAATATGQGVIGNAERWRTVLQEVGSTFGGVTSQIADSIANIINPAIDTSIDKFSQMQQAMQGMTVLLESIFGKKWGGILGGVLNIGLSLGKAFGGFRANGGPISAGTPYMVGERGPELVVPRSNGHVFSNSDLRGGRSGNITVNVNAKDAVLTQTVRHWVAEGVVLATKGGAHLAGQSAAWRGTRRLA